MDRITLKELLSQIEFENKIDFNNEKVVLAYKKNNEKYEKTISPDVLNAKLSDIKEYLNKEVKTIRMSKASDFLHYLVIVIKD